MTKEEKLRLIRVYEKLHETEEQARRRQWIEHEEELARLKEERKLLQEAKRKLRTKLRRK